MNGTQKPLLLDIPQVANLLGLSRQGVYNLLATKPFPVVHIGRSVRIPTKNLEAWIEAITDQSLP